MPAAWMVPPDGRVTLSVKGAPVSAVPLVVGDVGAGSADGVEEVEGGGVATVPRAGTKLAPHVAAPRAPAAYARARCPSSARSTREDVSRGGRGIERRRFIAAGIDTEQDPEAAPQLMPAAFTTPPEGLATVSV